MIRRLQALNYRCLRHLDVELGRRTLVTGPVGGGKSTLIGALAFLRDLVREGPVAAVAERTDDFRDLVWRRPNEDPGFELAVEFELPRECRATLPEARDFEVYRYEVAVRGDARRAWIHAERGILGPKPRSAGAAQPSLFPDVPDPPSTILASSRPGSRTVLSKTPGGMDRFYNERNPGRGWITDIALGPLRSALGTLPESPETRPATTAFKRVLEKGLTWLGPSARAMRRPSAPGAPDGAIVEDASNLPWVAARLRDESPQDFAAWVSLLRGAVPGLHDIRIAQREADRHGRLVVRYAGGLDAPSWVVSDGTLRLLALTLPAFVPGDDRILAVEEPERGLPAGALQALHAALSSIPGQLLATTTSPAFRNLFDPIAVLPLARREDGVVGVLSAECSATSAAT